MDIVRLDESFEDWNGLLDLILSSFAYMDGRIDPPSSAIRLTAGMLREKAAREIGHVIIQGHAVSGCIFCRPEEDCLYIGKLAVSPSAQGRGVGRALLTLAEEIARRKALPQLRLETRIELVENHAIFAAWGFEKTAENAHPGFSRTTSIEMRKIVSSVSPVSDRAGRD